MTVGVGLDPGSNATGWAVVEVAGPKWVRLASGVVRLPDAPLYLRLIRLNVALRDALWAWQCAAGVACTAVEAGHTRPGRTKSALVLGAARGVCLLHTRGVVYDDVQPSSLKLAITGNGRASKDQVRAVVARILDYEAPGTDESDALALAIVGLQRYRSGPR